MKTATYTALDGKKFSVDYDENAPCESCGEPVVEASMGGTVICPWCDCNKCRYCGQTMLTGREKTRAECLSVIRNHVRACKRR